MSETTIEHADDRLLEHGNPLEDGRAFRRSLGQYATGVAVITTRHGETLAGMAVNSFAAVSLDPPLILWSIRRESGSAPAFLEATHFAVNVLSADQVEVSQAFGASRPDKFSAATWSAGAHGVPLLNNAIAHLECRRESVHEGGDHLILVGYVERHARFAGEPLLFTQGQYAVPQSHPHLAPSPASTPGQLSYRLDSSFLGLLNATHHHLSMLFDEHRQSFGVTVASGRILHRLYERSLDIRELEKTTYLGCAAVEDALRDLLAQGHVVQEERRFSLTASGREKRQALAERATRFIQDRLSHIPASDVATAQRVLQVLQQS